jgi:hypothetical protein
VIPLPKLAEVSGQFAAIKILIVNRFFGGAQIPAGRMASGFAAVKGKKVGRWEGLKVGRFESGATKRRRLRD